MNELKKNFYNTQKMTNSNFDQLKKIKALYENGGLTDAEYNEMKNNLINDSVQNEK